MGVVNLPVRNTVDRLGIRVTCYELAIRDYVKQAGGIWRPRQQLWELTYGQILTLGLEDRIVQVQNDLGAAE